MSSLFFLIPLLQSINPHLFAVDIFCSKHTLTYGLDKNSVFARWHSVVCPIGPSFVGQVLGQEREDDKSRDRRSNQSPLFDCINYAFLEIGWITCLSAYPWALKFARRNWVIIYVVCLICDCFGRKRVLGRCKISLSGWKITAERFRLQKREEDSVLPFV